MLFLLFIVLPLLVGPVIDIGFTQVIGTQHCSYKDGDTKCTIFHIELHGWLRELLRFTLQLGLVLGLVFAFGAVSPGYANMMGRSPLGLVGAALFVATQSDLMEDFRRLLNGLLFRLKNR
jgi:hypothetical protein